MDTYIIKHIDMQTLSDNHISMTAQCANIIDIGMSLMKHEKI